MGSRTKSTSDCFHSGCRALCFHTIFPEQVNTKSQQRQISILDEDAVDVASKVSQLDLAGIDCITQPFPSALPMSSFTVVQPCFPAL